MNCAIIKIGIWDSALKAKECLEACKILYDHQRLRWDGDEFHIQITSQEDYEELAYLLDAYGVGFEVTEYV